MPNTTKKQFEFFKSEVLRYAEMFGLKEYQLYFFHQKLDCSYATINCDSAGRVASVRFSASTPDKLDDNQISKIACHEIIHLILGDMYDAATKRFTTDEAICLAEETAVVRITRAIKELENGG